MRAAAHSTHPNPYTSNNSTIPPAPPAPPNTISISPTHRPTFDKPRPPRALGRSPQLRVGGVIERPEALAVLFLDTGTLGSGCAQVGGGRVDQVVEVGAGLQPLVGGEEEVQVAVFGEE